MNDKMKWKALAVAAIIGLAIWKVYPPFNLYDKQGNITKEGKIKLGLDLRGGMHLVLEVEIDKLPEEQRKDATDRALEIIPNYENAARNRAKAMSDLKNHESVNGSETNK